MSPNDKMRLNGEFKQKKTQRDTYVEGLLPFDSN